MRAATSSLAEAIRQGPYETSPREARRAHRRASGDSLRSTRRARHWRRQWLPVVLIAGVVAAASLGAAVLSLL
jgi:hypothetical protein